MARRTDWQTDRRPDGPTAGPKATKFKTHVAGHNRGPSRRLPCPAPQRSHGAPATLALDKRRMSKRRCRHRRVRLPSAPGEVARWAPLPRLDGSTVGTTRGLSSVAAGGGPSGLAPERREVRSEDGLESRSEVGAPSSALHESWLCAGAFTAHVWHYNDTRLVPHLYFTGTALVMHWYCTCAALVLRVYCSGSVLIWHWYYKDLTHKYKYGAALPLHRHGTHEAKALLVHWCWVGAILVEHRCCAGAALEIHWYYSSTTLELHWSTGLTLALHWYDAGTTLALH